MTQTIAGLSGVIKTLYPQSDIERLFYGDCPAFGMIAKDTDAEGDPIRVALAHANGGGGSADFTIAQSTLQACGYTGFDLSVVDEYQLFRITTKAIRAAKSNKGALVRSLNSEIKGKMKAAKKIMCLDLYRNGSGMRGQVLSGQDTTTLTLTTATDMINFEVGDYVVASANADGSGATAGMTQITGINRAARTITAAAAFHADIDDGDYLFRAGDAAAKISGFSAWVPPAAPTATTFFGVNRTVDVERLGGLRHTASIADDQNIEGALINVGAQLFSVNASPDVVLMNPLDYAYMCRDLEGRTEIMKRAVGGDGKQIANISYHGVKLACGKGTVDVFPDPYCPRGTAWMLQLDTWKLYSYGPMPGWLDEDKAGNILRVYNADAYEGRIGAYWQLGCEAPGWNATINISAVNGTT